ncbi:MAG TPA: SusC/RagA family TonB-linked outer membrane protein, partial [Bacteroidales bacterium]|nr:SusC/RagA family TonB-linked outer membrane protein [Bacteroidales bacterium]
SQSNDSQGNIYTLASQMGRINYSYDGRYLLTITARRDGYSAFGANTSKYGLFPSVAVGWNIANESFMKNLKAINQLKLRVSYGETGNQAIGVNQTVTTASTVKYPFGGTALTGVLFSTMGNGNLNWETTTGVNVGLDFGLFQNRVSGTAEVYKTQTRDILLRRNLPAITGYNNVWANLGRMQNIGLDFTLKTVNVQTDNFRWVTDLNFSTYKNEILELYGDGKDDIGNNWFIGHPLRIIYDYEKVGIWQEGEDVSQTDPIAKPGDLKFKDQNGDHKITADDRVIIGQRDPKWIGGMTNTFTYKNFNLSIFLQTSQGGLKSNRDLTYADEAWRRNLPADFKYWTPENKSNYWPSLAAYKNYRGFQFAEDYSYVRIKDVTLSYMVPKSFICRYKLEGLTVYISGRNLYTFTKWFGWDPEMTYYSRGWSDSSGSWENNYPPVRTISFGLNLGL